MTDTQRIQPFSLLFDITTGLSDDRVSTKRHLSKMRSMFADNEAFIQTLAQDDPLVYEFYELDLPEASSNLLFGTSIVYPGRIGNEYYMTKGHFHTILDTSEVYYCLSGKGYLLMENPEGDWDVQEFYPGKAVYVPGRYAHRSINVGDSPLVTFFNFRADAGHDYGTIETRGFRHLIVEADGKPTIVPNPKWNEANV